MSSAGLRPLRSASPSGVSLSPPVALSPLGTPRGWELGAPRWVLPPPPRPAALPGRQGRRAGEVVSCLLGPQICSSPKREESWGGVGKGGGETCLEGLAGLGR